MFNFGLSEIAVIAAMVLILFGPKRFPEIVATIAKFLREIRGSIRETQEEMEIKFADEKEQKLLQSLKFKAESGINSDVQPIHKDPQ